MSADIEDLSSKGSSSLTASRSRRKGFCSEEMSSSSLYACLDECSTVQMLKGIENKDNLVSSS